MAVSCNPTVYGSVSMTGGGKITPFGVNLMSSQVLYWAAQECVYDTYQWLMSVTAMPCTTTFCNLGAHICSMTAGLQLGPRCSLCLSRQKLYNLWVRASMVLCALQYLAAWLMLLFLYADHAGQCRESHTVQTSYHVAQPCQQLCCVTGDKQSSLTITKHSLKHPNVHSYVPS